MQHNVYARVAVPAELVEADGGTWLLTDLEHDVIHAINPDQLEVELITEGVDDPGTVEIEINATSTEDARAIVDRVQSILDKHDPFDTMVGVD